MYAAVPSTIPLPNKLVKILEAKSRHDGRLPPESLAQWSLLQNALKETIETNLSYSSHTELESQATASQEILQRLNSTLTEGTFDQATTEAFQLYHSLAQYGALRKELRVTTLIQNDKLIHACKACQDGRLAFPEVIAILPSALEEIDVLVGYFKRATESLPENVNQGLLKGIQSCQVGFSTLQNMASLDSLGPEQTNTLKNAATNLRNGSLILQELQSWGVEIAEEESSAVPAVGDFVGLLRAQLAEQGRISDEALAEWVDKAFWDLQERWSDDRHDFFMTRPKKDKLVGSIDALMLRLRDLHEYSPKEQDEMLYLLEVKFEEVERCGFKLEELREHTLGWLADYLVAVLSQGVPRPHIESQIERFMGTDYDEYGRLLQSYLAENDRDYILDALAKIESEVQTAAL
jgi:hypothetical protein